MPARGSDTGGSNSPTAIQCGLLAVAQLLREQYISEHETDEPVEAWLPQASQLIDAWLLGSNPVGGPDTIYDEYHRLRDAAMWVVLMWDTEQSQATAMPGLRRQLGLPEQRPERSEAVARLDAWMERSIRGGGD